MSLRPLPPHVRFGRLLAKQVVAWVFTLIVSALISAAVFSLGVFSPSLTMAKDLAVYESRIRAASESLYGKLNASNYALSAAFSDKPFDATLNATIKSRMDKFKAMYNTKVIGYIDPYVSDAAGRGRERTGPSCTRVQRAALTGTDGCLRALVLGLKSRA